MMIGMINVLEQMRRNDEELKEFEKKLENFKSNHAIGEAIANDLFTKDFEPSNKLIPYSTLTDYVRSYLDYNEIEKSEVEIFQIRNRFVSHFCNLINTNTKYKASIELGGDKTYLKVTI